MFLFQKHSIAKKISRAPVRRERPGLKKHWECMAYEDKLSENIGPKKNTEKEGIVIGWEGLRFVWKKIISDVTLTLMVWKTN